MNRFQLIKIFEIDLRKILEREERTNKETRKINKTRIYRYFNKNVHKYNNCMYIIIIFNRVYRRKQQAL